MALETIEKLSQTVDFSDFASQIIHAIVVVLDTSSELRPVAMDTLCSLMTQLGQRYKLFIPMVKKVCPFPHPSLSPIFPSLSSQVMSKHKYSHSNYELLLVRLVRVSFRTPLSLVLQDSFALCPTGRAAVS